MVSSVNNSNVIAPPTFREAFTNKVSSVVYPIFKAIKNSLMYPFRLLGSKTFTIPGLLIRLPKAIIDKIRGVPTWKTDLLCNKGYHQFTYHNLSQHEVKEYLVYAAATAAIHKNDGRWMSPFGYQPMSVDAIDLGLDKKDGVFFDPSIGLKFSLYEKEDKVIVIFGAVSSHHSQFSIHEKNKAAWLSVKMQMAVVGDIIAGRPSLYTSADKAIRKLASSDAMKNKKIVLCGQSLGGSIASYVSLRQGLTAFALNSVPLGAGLQKKIGDYKLQQAENYLTQISASGDYPSDVPRVFKVLDSIANAFGLRTPGNFGKRLRVPSLYSSISATHSYILGSMLVKANPDLSSICQDMASSNRQTSKSGTKAVAESLHLAL